MGYPTSLTTSDWIDFLDTQCVTRDDKIAALATWHRRIDYDARQSVLGNLTDPTGVGNPVLASVSQALAIAIPAPVDYTPADTAPAVAFIAKGAVVTG